MTTQQELSVQKFRNQYKDNCLMYEGWGSADICNFGVYASDNENDKNITLIFTTITDLSDYGQPFTKVNNILIEPDGNVVILMETYKEGMVLDYINTLKRID
jgi:hypothetical protein